MFGDSASTVIANAQRAYYTAGVSANSYMQQVTSFSAALLQGLGGDTEKAASIADMALTDISDNVNKFGTNFESVQMAYQGFAKQNYTMLDNLKLGYGGTRTEMERLLNDATALTGVEYDINNLSDVYSAIHTIQEEIGITGTTTEEATSTMQGSLNMLSASWQNVLASMATGQGMDESINALINSVVSAARNLLPAVGNVLTEIPSVISRALPTITSSILNMIGDIIPQTTDSILAGLPAMFDAILGALPGLIRTLAESIPTTIDLFLQAIVSLINSLVDALPDIVSAIVDAIPTIIQGILEVVSNNLPALITGVTNLVVGIVEALPEIITVLVDQIPYIVETIVTVLVENAPLLIGACIQITAAVVAALPQILVSILKTLVNWVGGVINTLKTLAQNGSRLARIGLRVFGMALYLGLETF